MVLFNHATRELTAKIVYYGPGLCGKTTNLLVIFDKLDPKSKGKMLSLATKTDRTLFFDLLPVDIGKVGNFNLKIQLYTVPGQVFYNETRKLVLKGADAVVFVADSQGSMVESTRESFANLIDNLTENQIDPNEIPIVVQFNKRDIPGVLSVEDLQEALNLEGYPSTEASAIKGEGVMETFKLVSKITAKHLINRLQGKPALATKEAKDDKKKGKKPAAKAAAPPPPPVEEPVMELENPFSDSMPFPEAGPIDQGYDQMEEVSLESLLEGRDRPATFSGMTPIPVTFDDEVDHLHEDELIPHHDSVALALEEEPVPVATARGSKAAPEESRSSSSHRNEEIQQLRKDLAELRTENARLRDGMGRISAELAKLLKR